MSGYRLMRVAAAAVLFAAVTVFGENYLINGGQDSRIQYRLVQQVVPASATRTLTLSFVVPETFQSPTYNQKISDFVLDLNPPPSERKEERDKRGNRIIRTVWKNPEQAVDVSMSLIAVNRTLLQTIESSAPFPLTGLSADLSPNMTPYLSPSPQVQSDDPRIKEKSASLTAGVKTEFDAVQRVLTWVVDAMRYVTPPQKYDALYSLESGKGNCQNFSHLTAAVLRAAGIPTRIVNGVTLKQPYTVNTTEGEYTFKMGQGRHSWVEVYFPDLGWVPFDPQQTELFVSNRFIRIEVGVDNEETVNDGMIRWQQAKGASGDPRFTETIEAEFVSDQVRLTLEKQKYGPQNMLLCPPIKAAFKAVVVAPPPPPIKIPDDQLKQLQYSKPYLIGNLDFPQGVDFLFTRGPAEKGTEDNYEMKKNFMVETAEYVTTNLTQYAQVFILKKPLKLAKIGLAVHKFGGSGQVWIDLLADENGKPGKVLATSDFVQLDRFPSKAGYNWFDFDFGMAKPTLSPGRYWIGLGFTGSPIINWFYTYGKPVGPVDGTRYKPVDQEVWSGALTYEFNYRIAGWTTQQ